MPGSQRINCLPSLGGLVSRMALAGQPWAGRGPPVQIRYKPARPATPNDDLPRPTNQQVSAQIEGVSCGRCSAAAVHLQVVGQQPVAVGYVEQNCCSPLGPPGALEVREESWPRGLSSIAVWIWLILTVAQMVTMRNVMEAMLVVT